MHRQVRRNMPARLLDRGGKRSYALAERGSFGKLSRMLQILASRSYFPGANSLCGAFQRMRKCGELRDRTRALNFAEQLRCLFIEQREHFERQLHVAERDALQMRKINSGSLPE